MTDETPLLAELAGQELSRRSFLKWSGVVGGGAVVAGAGWKLGLVTATGDNPAAAATAGGSASSAKIVWSSCNINCGSRCPLRLVVENGQITRVEPDNTGNDVLGSQRIPACVRGRSIRQRIYNADRLKYPMKRVGNRGEGKFTRISWDEAFDTIVASLKHTIAEYGNDAVYIQYASGTAGANVAGGGLSNRLMNCIGGNLGQYGYYSTAQYQAVSPYWYGTPFPSGNSYDDIVHSQLVVLWGANPMGTFMSGGAETFVLEQAKKIGGTKVIVVDPRLSDTAVTMADEWVPLRPGTDAALVAGMAYVMITEGLHDQSFLDEYTIGFDEEHMPSGIPAGSSYKSYVMGTGPDKTAKTPEWAQRISGVPATKIVALAREIAEAKPCAIFQGWGPQRSFIGDSSVRGPYLLAAMTGNVGIHGGGVGAPQGDYSLPIAYMPTGTNPVKATISFFTWTEAIERGPEMTALADGVQGVDRLRVPIKFIWNYAGNTMINQHADCNRTAQILADTSKCEMIVVIDNQMTPSARYADILLPDTSNAEQTDLIPQGSTGPLGYTILASQAIEPLFESKPAYEICAEIATRMGVEQEFTEGKTQEQWVRELVAESQKTVPGLPDYDELAAMGIWRQPYAPDHTIVGFQAFREDPKKNPLATPSGKIEIFSKGLWELNRTWTLPKGQQISPIPAWYDYPEGPTDPLRKTYPLQCMGHHFKGRTHSTYANVPWMQEAQPQVVWMNPVDAEARGIANGDNVYVFNSRGRIRIPARVTPRIGPGVISVPEGAWYTPDADGVDVGGCANTLTTQMPTPLAKGNGQYTMLAQVELA
ncbi:MAG TPA: DMSO/selenate family reductase complex A subunit [Acidimicrobiales bacterium]|nr:DMSO/selenate family reductase complex A subunit [Acidimicrobiales bacterium]